MGTPQKLGPPDRRPPTAPADRRFDRAALHAEFVALAKLCFFNAEYLNRRLRQWRKIDVGLNILAAGVAGIAATAGLAKLTSTQTVSILALISAVLVALRANLDASGRAQRREKASDQLESVYTEAKRYARVDLDHDEWDASRQRLELLTQRRDKAFELTSAVYLSLEAAAAQRGYVFRKKPIFLSLPRKVLRIVGEVEWTDPDDQSAGH